MSLGSGFAALAGLFPGYLNGYRTVIQDNWQDRFNGAKLYAANRENALGDALFGNNVMLSDLALDNAFLQTKNNVRNDFYYDAMVPQYMAMINAGNMFAPYQAFGKGFGDLALMGAMMRGYGISPLQTKAMSIG